MINIKISINTNAKKWPIINDKTFKVLPTNEDVVKVRVGIADYDFQGEWDIEIFMRKSIYDKLISGEYRVRPNEEEVVVEDKNGNYIPPLSTDGQTIY